MNRQSKRLVTTLFLLLFTEHLCAQTENWVYTYNGPDCASDLCWSLTYGANGTVYAGGYSSDSTGWPNEQSNLCVISIDTSGMQNWVYIYDTPYKWHDAAYDVVFGPDSNVYVAGFSDGGMVTNADFTVISLADSGTENWMYKYKGTWDDVACEIAFDTEGNLYVAGRSDSINQPSYVFADIFVVSLTLKGDTNWTYRYDGPAHYFDEARSIVFGLDGNIYVAGTSCAVSGDPSSAELTVICLGVKGNVNWIYKYEDPNRYYDGAQSMVYGADNNIYVAGFTCPILNQFSSDFTVWSISTAGIENWVYTYNGPADEDDKALSIANGTDGNIYAGGWSTGIGTDDDFTVISLADSGTQNWVYRYNGTDSLTDRALAIACGPDSFIYAGGSTVNTGTYRDFTVTCLSRTGQEQWIYTYDGPWQFADDEAKDIIYGGDSRIYAGGFSIGIENSSDFTVISLRDETGVCEQQNDAHQPLAVRASSFFRDKILLEFAHASSASLDIILYNALGQKVFETSISSTPSSLYLKDERISRLSEGIYFLSHTMNGTKIPAMKIVKY